MSAQYARDNCKIAVAKILQTIGWHSINSTPLEVLTDILARYVHQISKTTNNYASEFGQTEPNLDHLGLAFHEMGINLQELEEYVTYVNFAPGPAPVPKFPIPKENNLNFLKPGSKEVVTRPVYIHEHLPPMYPLLEGTDNETETVAVKQEVAEEETTDGAQQFKKPADVSSPEFKRPKREEEGSRPTREISSVMMTTSGFLSPAREGKLPEARTPAPPPIPEPAPPVTTSPLESGRKKVDKKKERLGKELFKPISEEKVLKKTPTMKDVVKMKQMKAAAAAAANMAAANSTPNVIPANVSTSNEVKILPIPQHKPPQKQNFNKDLAAAKAKTEKFNTTITPIPMKPRSPHPPPTPLSQVDKLFSEPDKKKVNIFKKISNVKEKHESKAKKDVRANLLMNEASPVDIVNKITHLSSDITIEPIMNPFPVSRSPDKLDSYFDHNSPIGTPSTPKTPEIIAPSPPLPKEKRKRKDGGQKRKRVKKNVNLLEPDIIDITMERPKTPEAHIVPHMRHQPPPNLLPPSIPYPLLRYSGPGLIPNNLNESLPLFPFPYLSNIPDFGINPYFPSMPPNMPSQAKAPPTPKVKEHVEKPVEIIPQPAPAPQPISAEEPSPSISTPSEVKDKKTKDHKKEKKEKIKKKNKKDKVKEKSEKKKLKELKKDSKEKIKKEKKEKKVKEKEIREGESPIPKILLKVNSPSPRPETPESTRKLNIKPIIKKDQEPSPEEKKRDASPVGLAKISALVTGPPKPKTSNLSPVTPVAAERPVTEETPPVPVPRTPGRPRLHPVKPKPPPKPKKIEQTFKKMDEHGNEVWICPACSQQDDGRPMIGCDGCDAWYHWVCVGIQVPPDENENWYCKPCLCRKNEDLQSDKKRKRKKRDKKEH
ncbi:transcription initiation factor TFIID subunit 3 [Anoplophora glabripennis]|nr:transcription initiation factor TFIID subunit 3 [Anoplophora glabripennis]